MLGETLQESGPRRAELRTPDVDYGQYESYGQLNARFWQ